MAEARDQMEWNHTFAVLVQLGNNGRGPDDDWHDPLECYPWPREEDQHTPPEPSPGLEQALARRFAGGRRT